MGGSPTHGRDKHDAPRGVLSGVSRSPGDIFMPETQWGESAACVEASYDELERSTCLLGVATRL